MASVRVSDTSIWLHNKLGTNSDTWSVGAIYSQLNQEVLRNIKECFVDLQPQVKLKLLLSFLEFPRRSLEEWKLELEEILEIAQEDGEPWVSVLAETLKTVPSTGSLNESVCDNTSDETRKMIAEMTADLRTLVKNQGETIMLPLECSYLNRSALSSSIGQLPQPVRHFTLKRKPKSQALRADLLQKSADLQNNVKKNPAPTVPLRTRGLPRKMNDTTPLKGIPSKFGFGSLSRVGPAAVTPPAAQDGRSRVPPRPIAGKKEVGVKLLDINEQPLGYAAMKKRKKQQETEAAAKAAEAQALITPITPEEKKADQPPALPTPDYAAGLLPPMTPAFQPPLSPPTPAYAPLASPASSGPSQKTVVRMIPQQPVPQQRAAPVLTQQHITPMQQMPHQTVLRQVVTLQPQQPLHQPLLQQQIEPQFSMPPPKPVAQQPVIQQTPQPKKTVALMLTREQMQEAQEMFRNSNRVTRPEKALILGFMAGSRENPCPHLGNIVTIKLSEDEEIVHQPDNSTVRMVVETHFQMNYNLGEWKRIKKYKKMDPQVAGMLAATVTA